MTIHLKRAYDPADWADGRRVLVDRLWPRGLSKADSHFDLWLKDVAPSTELRKWFHEDQSRWEEFCARYRQELSRNPEAIDQLLQLARSGNLTLAYASRDQDHNHARVLADYLHKRLS